MGKKAPCASREALPHRSRKTWTSTWRYDAMLTGSHLTRTTPCTTQAVDLICF